MGEPRGEKRRIAARMACGGPRVSSASSANTPRTARAPRAGQECRSPCTPMGSARRSGRRRSGRWAHHLFTRGRRRETAGRRVPVTARRDREQGCAQQQGRKLLVWSAGRPLPCVRVVSHHGRPAPGSPAAAPRPLRAVVLWGAQVRVQRAGMDSRRRSGEAAAGRDVGHGSPPEHVEGNGPRYGRNGRTPENTVA